MVCYAFDFWAHKCCLVKNEFEIPTDLSLHQLLLTPMPNALFEAYQKAANFLVCQSQWRYCMAQHGLYLLL